VTEDSAVTNNDNQRDFSGFHGGGVWSRDVFWVLAPRLEVTDIFFVTTFRPVTNSTLPPIKWVPLPHSPGIKQPQRETDH